MKAEAASQSALSAVKGAPPKEKDSQASGLSPDTYDPFQGSLDDDMDLPGPPPVVSRALLEACAHSER